MKASPAKCLASLLLALAAFGSAQEEPVGVLSYVDIDPVALERLGACLSASPDPLKRDCMPHVELVVRETFDACQQDLATCEQRYALPVPFVPEQVAEDAEEAIDEAWEAFVDRTIDIANEELNTFPFCWVPNVCPAVTINWGCVVERQLKAVERSLTEHLPTYWNEARAAIMTHLPTALWWRSPVPETGAVIVPVMSFEPKPQQYAELFEGPRDPAYYVQPYFLPRVPVPYTQDEVPGEPPGIPELEERKRQLEPATLLEYQEFGFTSFFQVYGDFQNTLFFKLLRGPYVWAACIAYAIPIPIPVPAPLFIPLVPKAFHAYESVPEGYSIPRVQGRPLF